MKTEKQEENSNDNKVIEHYKDLKYYNIIVNILALINAFNILFPTIDKLYNFENMWIFNIYIIIWNSLMIIFSFLTFNCKHIVIFIKKQIK